MKWFCFFVLIFSKINTFAARSCTEEEFSRLISKGFPAGTKTLGATLFNWCDEIDRMWRFSKTNLITYGLHNKMEMISRRAAGFRNFDS